MPAAELVHALREATRELEDAVARDDLDAIEAALARRQDTIAALEGCAIPPELSQAMADLVDRDRRLHEQLAARRDATRDELARIGRARSIAGRLREGRAPARFFNQRV